MVTFEDAKMNILYWLRITGEENELSERLGKKIFEMSLAD